MPRKLIQLVTGLPPQVDGVGDYALTLARALRDDQEVESLFVVANPRWSGPNIIEGFRVVMLPERSKKGLHFALDRITDESGAPRDTPLLLHCSLYGFATRALALWLVAGVERWRRERPRSILITMFHELDAWGSIWTSAFWLNPIHCWILRRLARQSNVHFVSNARYARSLAQIAGIREENIERMPVLSTVGEPPRDWPQNLGSRDRQLVIFGRQASRDAIFFEQTSLLERTCKVLGITRIVEIGPGRTLRTLPFIQVETLGVLEAPWVSAVLRNSLFGFVSLEPDRLGKSSVFASFCAHGVCPIVSGVGTGEEDGLVEGVHYLLADQFAPCADDRLEAIASSAFRWYQEHPARVQARRYADVAFPGTGGDPERAELPDQKANKPSLTADDLTQKTVHANPQRHLPALDGVRGLAVILVLVVHLMNSNDALTQSSLINVAMAFRSLGWMGVDLFFVLSGFLITGILYETVNRPSFMRNFYARRFLRIVPLYYGALVFLFAFTGPLGIRWDGTKLALLGYLQNTPHWLDRMNVTVSTYCGHFWSLAVEEQFYLVWPVVVLLVRDRRKLLVTALLLSALALAGRVFAVSHGMNPEYTYRMTIFRMDSLLMGACLALIVAHPSGKRALRIAPSVFAVTFGLTLTISLIVRPGNFEPINSKFFNSVGYSLLAIAFAGLVGSVLRTNSRFETVFSNSLLRWFGTYSYGIYIFHFIILGILGLGPRKFLAEHFHSKAVAVVGAAIPALALTLLCAWLCYHLFEQPLLGLKRHFGYTMDSSSIVGELRPHPSYLGTDLDPVRRSG